ncbi:DUF4388 domain-containing protein [Thermus thermamylovorans]|uniref:DUF4388 domain-containing protein n=1 Tax=Thermus thermamylovorans TaxID=2509362 RepID=A0A4Q9B8W4_9DEIN|nr:DUF4388 domain-containing protein [Thermus thermamylovorans]TBH21748.1 DUF4388 domain-containing protein [Thermus thermamylovorans]
MEGDFRLLGPIDLLQLLAQGGRTGVFQVEAGGERGEVYLERGKPVHAAFRGRVGEEALLAVLALKEGRFRFLPAVRPPVGSLEGPLEAYLLRAVRHLDEGAEVGPFDLVRPAPRAQALRATLDPAEGALLLALGPGKSPLDLAAEGPLPLGEVLRRLGHLARLRLVEVAPRVPRTARLQVALGHKGAQVEALLLRAWQGHYGPFRQVRVRGQGPGEVALAVEGIEGLGVALRLSPELLLFHGLRVGEEVWVWPEV